MQIFTVCVISYLKSRFVAGVASIHSRKVTTFFSIIPKKKEIIALKNKTALARLRRARAVAVVRKEVSPPSWQGTSFFLYLVLVLFAELSVKAVHRVC